MAVIRRCRMHKHIECKYCVNWRHFDSAGAVWLYEDDSAPPPFTYDSVNDTSGYDSTSDSGSSCGSGGGSD